MFEIFNGNILATFCANMMKINPVTPEITRVTNGPFWTKRLKSAYLTEYLTNYWTDLHQRFSFGRYDRPNFTTCRSCIVATLSEAGVRRSRSSSTDRQRYQGFSYERRHHAQPVFVETPQNISVGPGDRAVLRCRVENLGTKTVWRLLYCSDFIDSILLARDVICTSRAYAMMPVRLSVCL